MSKRIGGAFARTESDAERGEIVVLQDSAGRVVAGGFIAANDAEFYSMQRFYRTSLVEVELQ